MQEPHGKGWMSCPPGVLDRLAAKLRNRKLSMRRTNTIAAVISCTVIAGILGLAGVLASQALGYSVFSSSSSSPRTQQQKPYRAQH